MFKLLWVRTWEKLGFAHLRAREGRLEERDTGERRQEGLNLGTTWMDLVRIYSLGVWSEWRTSQNEAYYSLVWINVRCCNEACLCLYRKYFHLTYFPLWNCENGRLVACHFRLQEEKEKWVGAEYQWLWWECELILLGEEMVCISYDWIQLQLRKNPPRSGLNKELVQCFKLPWGTQVPSVFMIARLLFFYRPLVHVPGKKGKRPDAWICPLLNSFPRSPIQWLLPGVGHVVTLSCKRV